MKSSHSQTMRLQTWIAESLKCFIKAVLQSETEGLSHSCTPCKLHVNNKTSLIIISRNCTTPSVGWDYMVVYPDNHQQWRGSPIWRARIAAVQCSAQSALKSTGKHKVKFEEKNVPFQIQLVSCQARPASAHILCPLKSIEVQSNFFCGRKALRLLREDPCKDFRCSTGILP